MPKRAQTGQLIAAYVVAIILAVAVTGLFIMTNPFGPPELKPRMELVNGKPCGAYVMLRGKYLPPNVLVNIRYTFYHTTRFEVPDASFFSWDQTIYTDANGQFMILVDPIARMDEVGAKEIYYIIQLQSNAALIGIPLGLGRTTPQSKELFVISMPGSARLDIDEAYAPPANSAISNPWHAIYYRDRDLFAAIDIGEANTQMALWFPDGLAQALPTVPLNPTNHSASFTRTVHFVGPLNLQFMLQADDGAQVYHSEDGLNWASIIDAKTSDGQAKPVNLPFRLGDHYFKVNYFEGSGAAKLCFFWRENYAGWKARYYTDTQMSSSPNMILDDAQIDFNWQNNGPTNLPAGHALQAGNYSVSWDRIFNIAGEYEFRLETDQYARVYVDGHLLSTLSRWPSDNVGFAAGTSPALHATQVCRLREGTHRISVHYRNTGNPARIKFDILSLNATIRPDLGQEIVCL